MVYPGNYAVVGAAATAAAATHTISVAVIAIELTGQPHLFLPIGLAVCAAFLLARELGPSVFDFFRRVAKIPEYASATCGGEDADSKVAGDVAQPVTEVPCVTSNTTVAAIQEILEWGRAMHAVHYPVVDNLT
eukprot:CAMPEP_0118942202 /NCGR_PEP_ID=MMETSP1169-20130426/35683_1 /TAXON_ID=36882 /ORGANISM="Pyramimonas obovata, Strain CCMP722" /LENGTH=132 /DNA_ID=CAMNT_0006887181 /DNA_START=27 /DNA_END=421 /DNA_ORIENTATION=-